MELKLNSKRISLENIQNFKEFISELDYEDLYVLNKIIIEETSDRIEETLEKKSLKHNN